ncbi:hypothetical protein [Tumebacillus permanentifrigoris]|uniref:Uncharacterized protein n=1 Tax=Tumebacillus permanentifrigoris TaxID=378543 RepID=A0A316D6U3_9BACL|nr:hypothetical protein [Tumebacillus permanentifrigoris]PWK07498.1 hypothetical protein C7459_11797 [Tumebacillus permanentifrigoris]
MSSTNAASLEDIQMGPCIVRIDPDLPTELVINLTDDDIKFNCKEETIDVTVSQYGKTVVAKVSNGIVATIEASIASSKIVILDMAYSSTETVTDTTDPTKKALLLKSKVGKNLFKRARPVRIEPLGGTEEDWVTFPKAIIEADIKRAYQVGKIHATPLMITAIPDILNDDTTVIFGDGTIV